VIPRERTSYLSGGTGDVETKYGSARLSTFSTATESRCVPLDCRRDDANSPYPTPNVSTFPCIPPSMTSLFHNSIMDSAEIEQDMSNSLEDFTDEAMSGDSSFYG
jgi:hypothetical protein